MALYEFGANGLRTIEPTTFRNAEIRERDDLQRVLRDHFGVIDEDVLIIAEEFSGWSDSSRRIDLLGVDRAGQLVVIELKRSHTGGHMELQALRYAAMVRAMTFERAVEVFEQYLVSRSMSSEDAEKQILEHMEVPEREDFGAIVRIVLIAADFNDRELTSTVLWLRENDIDIQCFRLSPYSYDGEVLLDVQRIIPLPETADYEVNLKEKATEERRARRERGAWSGFYFANIGMDDPSQPITTGRHWENCRKYGYIAAGGGSRWSDRLKSREVGDRLFAYVSKAGYVGFGEVVQKAQPAHEFVLEDGSMLRDCVRSMQGANQHNDRSRWEYVIGVKWHATVAIDEAKKFAGISALPHNIYKLRDEKTVSFLCNEFGIGAE